MDFNVNDWLGDWISFEHLINNHDPNLTGLLGRLDESHAICRCSRS